MKKQITIRIFSDGHIQSETHGMKGKTCLKHLKALENLLEARVVDSDFTSEYYEQEVEQSNETVQELKLG